MRTYNKLIAHLTLLIKYCLSFRYIYYCLSFHYSICIAYLLFILSFLHKGADVYIVPLWASSLVDEDIDLDMEGVDADLHLKDKEKYLRAPNDLTIIQLGDHSNFSHFNSKYRFLHVLLMKLYYFNLQNSSFVWFKACNTRGQT